MKIIGIRNEDFTNYKDPSLFICTASCDFKCDRECGRPVCQNSDLIGEARTEVDDDVIITHYLENPITKAIIFGGLEPFDQYDELFQFINKLRLEYECLDPVVIYTGYIYREIEGEVRMLSVFPNIIVKFGRFRPGQEPHFDSVLGVNLASDNQFAKVIS
jgi:hypothetical protein